MSKKILIVDDDLDTLKVTANLLDGKGHYEVSTLTDSTKAIDKIRSEKPDLVILDVMMPKVNGFVLTKSIKDDPALQRIKIIIYTGKIFEVDKKKAFQLGADAYVTKLLESDKLIETIDKVLES